MNWNTCDLCDANESRLADGTLRVMTPGLHCFGQHHKFYGRAATLKVFEDNALVRSMLETQGSGQILVIDGGASVRCALVGGNLGALAAKNGWAGIIVNGSVRDSEELATCGLGILALGTCPVRSQKAGRGESHVQVQLCGVIVRPGDWVYVDSDGSLVSSLPLH
jgi:regulator of ribonuclease activity A